MYGIDGNYVPKEARIARTAESGLVSTGLPVAASTAARARAVENCASMMASHAARPEAAAASSASWAAPSPRFKAGIAIDAQVVTSWTGISR